MKHFILLLSFVFLFTATFSQNKTRSNKQNTTGHCATDYLHTALKDQSPSYKRKLDEMNKNYQERALKYGNSTGNKPGGSGNNTQAYQPATLPVVFHMLIRGTTSPNPAASATDNNLTKTQIKIALDTLNALFAGNAAGSKAAGFNTDIQFCLAEVDNFGNAITSYTYTDASFTTPLDNTNQPQITAWSNFVQSSGRFPTTKYINIYVVEDIAGTVAGFAYMPPAHGSGFDGIYIEAQYLLKPAITNLTYNMTVLTHEMGHYLGMFHTFGICTTLSSACSCYNNNCLFDGDMVCDTPPDFSQNPTVGGCITPTNTCTSDVAAMGDGLNLTADVPDLTDNYMDYGDWNCQHTFTQGQVRRMHFMIDDTIGPRNSLLHSAVCNTACINPGCTVSINPITTTSVTGIQLLNTLTLTTPGNVTYSFSANNCGSYDTFNWTIVDQSNNTVVQAGIGLGFNATFTATGNYAVVFNASIAGSDPLCFQSPTLNIQVVPPPKCSENIDMAGGWTSGSWQRIQYEGGWARTADNTASFVHASTSFTALASTVANGTTPADAFSFTNSVSSDPNFLGTTMPPGITNVMRVGRLITTTTALPAGDANYVTYTFSPTNANAKMRVYYLGLKEQDPLHPVGYYNTFASNAGAKTGFGFVCSYNFNSITTAGIGKKGLTEAGVNGIYFSQNDMVTDYVNSPPTTPYSIGTSTFDRMTGWQYMDLDFTEFICASPTITITFFARADEASTPGILHSYAYFGTQCLPGNYTNINLNLPNRDIACMNDVTESCVREYLPSPNNLSIYQNYFNLNDILDVDVDVSNDNITYTSTTIPLLLNFNWSSNMIEPYVNLCKAPDTNPYIYYRITYKTLCQTITNTVSIFQGFVHTINDCAPNPMSGGHFINPLVTIGTATISPDQYVQYCGTTTLALQRPCWLAPADPDPAYQWQVGWSWADIPGATQSTLSVNDQNNACRPYRRMAKYHDPFCNTDTWIPSDIFFLTSYKANIFNVSISGPDVCGNSLATFSLNNIYEIIDITNCDMELAAQTATAPVTNTLTFQFFSNSACTASITPSAGSGTLSYTYTNSISSTSPINVVYTFSNSGIYVSSGLIYALATFERFGCISTVTLSIPIYIKPSAVAGTITAPGSICAGGNYTITGDNGNGTGYYWEYSYSPAFTTTLTLTGPTTSSLVVTSTTFTGYPVYVRRVANGTTVCPDVAYSNTLSLNSTSVTLTITPSASTICAGTSETITASGADSYTWTCPSGTSTLNPYVTTPTVSTVYTVTGVNASGCISTQTVMITLSNGSVTISPSSSTICAGASETLTASGSASYTWTTPAGTSTLNPLVVTPTVTTIYTVTGVSAGGCVGTSTVNITVNPVPIITGSLSTGTVCAGSCATATLFGGVTYTIVGPSFVSNSNPVTICPTVTTVYTISATNGFGCVSTRTAVINVTPPSTITISPSTTTICAGASATLTAGGGTTYTWTPTSGTVNPLIVSPTVTTVYTVAAESDKGCPATQTATVYVNPSPTLTGVSSHTICQGGSYSYTAGGATSYTWTSAGSSSTLNPITFSPTVTTTYTLTGTNAYGCSNTLVFTITVLPLPTITAGATSLTICAGQSTTLTASGAVTYTWVTPSSSTTANPLAVSPTVTTTYTVYGTPQGNGCVGSKTIQIVVKPTPTVTISGITSICSGSCTILTASGGGTYSWSAGATTSTICATAGIQSVVVTGTNGCTSTKTINVTTGTTPTITATASAYTICSGATTTLTASGATSYTWTAPSPTNPAVVSPTANTTYTVLGIQGNGPCVGTQTITIFVNPKPIVIISGNTFICSGSCASLTASGGGTYLWNTGATTSTVCLTSPGVYSVTVTNASGCSTTATVNVTTGSTPYFPVSASPATICPGGSSTLTASGGTSYTWTAPGYSGNTNPAAVHPTVTTTYTLTGVEGNSCPGTNTITVYVLPIPTVAISGATAGCAPVSATLNASGGGTYTWSTGVHTTSISVTVTATTSYTVIVTAPSGCTVSSVATVTVYPNPVPTISGNTLICAGQTATLTASGLGMFGSYHWSTGSSSAVITTNLGGVYTVTATNLFSCTGTVAVTVSIAPTPTANITGNLVICPPATTTLTATGGVTYTWSTGATTSTLLVSTTGVKTVTVTDANGCTAVKSVTVTSPINCAKRPGGTGPGTGITAELYPNPTNTSFSVRSESDISSVEVFDYTGRLIKHIRKEENPGFNEIDMRAYTEGTYFVRVIISDGMYRFFKLIRSN